MNKKLKLEKDFLDFIRLCNEHDVEYLVIGGYAVSIHGYVRYTKDMDVSIRISDSNAEKMIVVMKKFGFASLNLAKEDFTRSGNYLQLGCEPVRLDIINNISGVDFEEALKNKKVVVYEGIPINFIGYEELLVNKLQAGRLQDLADIEKLKARNKKR